MNIIYATSPRHPGGTNDPHWLITVVEGMRILSGEVMTDWIVRVKRIPFLGRTAYLLKNHSNKTRVIMYGAGDKIFTLTATPPAPDLNSPYLPLYPNETSAQCEKREFDMAAGKLYKLAEYCVKQMTKQTYYSTDSFQRIPLSSDGHDGFFFGQITDVKQIAKGSVPYWSITTELPGPKRVTLVRVSAIRYDNIKDRHFLVYKNESEADIIAKTELGAFYEVAVGDVVV